MNTHPLIVDLDGTLIHTDMLHESIMKLFRDSSWNFLRLPTWLRRGKARIKQLISERVTCDPTLLPYNHTLLNWLHEQKAQGRELILCTASDKKIADSIAEHLGCFDEVMASNGDVNLAGVHKAAALTSRFGQQGFDYVGNSRQDIPVWKSARRAIVVNAPQKVLKKAQQSCEVEHIIPNKTAGFSVWKRVFRMSQWLKNTLLFVPLIAAHQITSLDSLSLLLQAFVAFSLCASSVYIGNDLLDLESDRRHARKSSRPFAAGLIPISTGILCIPILLLSSFTLAHHVGQAFCHWLLLYFVLTCAYSCGLKRVALIDCTILSLLYTLRIIAGAAATGLYLSFWLLTCSVFLFLSLAFVKRYAEMKLMSASSIDHASHQPSLHGRGYALSDAPLIAIQGLASGYLSVLVLALYLNNPAVSKLYQQPTLLWIEVPLMLLWINRIWLYAHRAHMPDDPFLFAIKDRASLCMGALFILILGMATHPLW